MNLFEERVTNHMFLKISIYKEKEKKRKVRNHIRWEHINMRKICDTLLRYERERE